MTTWTMVLVFWATQILHPQGFADTGYRDIQTIVVSDIASEEACQKLATDLDTALLLARKPLCVSVVKVRS